MPKLPLDVLRQRLRNEMESCISELKNYSFTLSDDTLSRFPLTIKTSIRGVPGPVLRGDRVTHQFSHHFTMKITEEYPYHKPIVIWESDIFHPNIMTPEDGGFVCTRLLDEWSFNSTLLVFLRGVAALLSNPNPDNAYISESCVNAAKFFSQNPYKPPAILKEKERTGVRPPEVRQRPRIVTEGR